MQGSARRLDIGLWQLAWDRYALAAQTAEHQLSFRAAMSHKEVVLEIAYCAKSSGRSELLGVLYDELARSFACARMSVRMCLR